MSVKDIGASLGANQFAFHFSGDGKIPAQLLGDFLRSSASAARRRGIDLEVVGVEPGSLTVVLNAVKLAAASIKSEFKKAPIATTSGFVAIAVAAISQSMSPESSPGGSGCK